MAEPKIVITGTGRAGTTLLVQLLDDLGLDTGLGSGRLTKYQRGVGAGLECRLDDPDVPTVVKDMTLGFRMRDILDAGHVEVAHVLIPIRRLDIAAASRVRAAGYGRLPFRQGALVGTLKATRQGDVLPKMLDGVILALKDHNIPYTEIEFPRFATDPDYFYDKLGFLVPGAARELFADALARIVKPDMIHETPLSRGERWRTRLTTVWMVGVRYPIARFRRWVDPEGSQERLRRSVAAKQQAQEAATVAEEAERLAAEAARRAESGGAPPAESAPADGAPPAGAGSAGGGRAPLP